MTRYQVLYDPRRASAHLPLDREPHLQLAHAVLAAAPGALPLGDCEQVALLLTGHAYAVAEDVHRLTVQQPPGSGRRILAEIVLQEAMDLLARPLVGSLSCAQERARVVRDLYARLDRLEGTTSLPPDPQARRSPP